VLTIVNKMDVLSTALLWLSHATAAWLMAGAVAGVGITLLQHRDRRQAPSEAAVHHTATQYRLHYGTAAVDLITDHILGASLARNREYKDFLRRVRVVLEGGGVGGVKQTPYSNGIS
jgi:hypothetical protein